MARQHYEDQVAEAVRQVKERCGDSQARLAETVPEELGQEPIRHWKAVVEAVSEERLKIAVFEV